MASFDSNRIVTNKLKFTNAEQFFSYVANGTPNTGLYLYAGYSIPFPNTSNEIIPPDSFAEFSVSGVPDNTTSESISDYNNMLFGKQITAENIAPMIPRYDWISGTVYAHYIDKDANLFSEQFYVGINNGSSYDVFVCIENNNASPSTVPPNILDTSPDAAFYQTSDGYQWKYMYSIPISSFNQFATSDFIPVFTNANVSANAISGSIDMIDVANSGSFYNNYISGQFSFSDIQVNGNPLAYNIANTASSNNNFYLNSILVLTEGTGAGQYRNITGYTVSGNTKIATVNVAFSTIPDTTTLYEISPLINIVGDGNQTINAVARGLVNSSSSNSIYQVEILNRGAGYRVATASVLVSNTIPANGAQVYPIISPPGGHGYDPYNELGATRIGIGVSFANSEGGTITTYNQYSQIGIIKDPLFANVTINTLNSSGTLGSNGTFIPLETLFQFTPIYLTGTVSINTSSNVITGYASSNATNGTFQTDFVNALDVGEYLFVTSGSNTFISQISQISNSTSLIVSSNGSFVSSTANIAIASISANAKVSYVTGGIVTLTDLQGIIKDGGLLVGNSSGATAIVNNYLITANNKPFFTFNQLLSFTGSVSGNLIPGEIVSQADTNSTAYVHSFDGTRLYLTNVSGIISANDTLTGQTSGAIFTTSIKYAGDLVIDSGKILYIEDLVQPIPRANNQTESSKIILEF